MKALRKAKHHLLFNKILGANIVAWGIAGWLESDTIGVPRIAVTLLNLLVGLLIFLRPYPTSALKINGRSYWLLALLSSGVLFKLSTPLHSWNTTAQIVFSIGSFITLISLMWLGKEFGIRPGKRTLMSSGPYRLVRHPAYLGECIMALGCTMGKPNVFTLIVLMLLVLFQGLRALSEERILDTSSNYQTYILKTRWRILPFIW